MIPDNIVGIGVNLNCRGADGVFKVPLMSVVTSSGGGRKYKGEDSASAEGPRLILSARALIPTFCRLPASALKVQTSLI